MKKIDNILKKILPQVLYVKITAFYHFLLHFYFFRNVRNARKIIPYILKGRKTIFCNTKINPVYFFGTFGLSSFKLGGVYLIEALRRIGVNARSGRNIPAGTIHDSIIVFVKAGFPEDLRSIKSNQNKIIIDVRDNYCSDYGVLNPDFAGRDIADLLIFPNQALLDRFLEIGSTSSNCLVLYGYPDPAITYFFQQNGYKKINELKSCYFGFDYNLDIQKVNNLQKRMSIDIIPLSEFNFNKYLPKLRDVNMHIDWNPIQENCLYKPLTKILIAAECRSNIIIKKTPRVLEVLPSDYPFLVEDNDLETIMERAYTIFNTKQWEDALSVMDSIREKYSFYNHMEQFIDVLKRTEL
ncbi:hypothetical protein ACFL03_16225 [Thermodesulfobacteriota bacterium]